MEMFMVKGIDIIVSRLVKSSLILNQQQRYIEPDNHRDYKVVVIMSVDAQRRLVTNSCAKGHVCFNIKLLKDKLVREDIRVGTILLKIAFKPEPVIDFYDEVQMLKHH
jgi:GTPase